MKNVILILGLTLATLTSSATIVRGNYLRTIKTSHGTTVVCLKSQNNCISVVVREVDDFPAGSWKVTVYGNGDETNIVDKFIAVGKFVKNPDGEDPAESDSYFFQLP